MNGVQVKKGHFPSGAKDFKGEEVVIILRHGVNYDCS